MCGRTKGHKVLCLVLSAIMVAAVVAQIIYVYTAPSFFLTVFKAEVTPSNSWGSKPEPFPAFLICPAVNLTDDGLDVVELGTVQCEFIPKGSSKNINTVVTSNIPLPTTEQVTLNVPQSNGVMSPFTFNCQQWNFGQVNTTGGTLQAASAIDSIVCQHTGKLNTSAPVSSGSSSSSTPDYSTTPSSYEIISSSAGLFTSMLVYFFDPSSVNETKPTSISQFNLAVSDEINVFTITRLTWHFPDTTELKTFQVAQSQEASYYNSLYATFATTYFTINFATGGVNDLYSFAPYNFYSIFSSFVLLCAFLTCFYHSGAWCIDARDGTLNKASHMQDVLDRSEINPNGIYQANRGNDYESP